MLSSDYDPALPSIIFDLRALNQQTQKSIFDKFWESLSEKLVKFQAAHDKRRADHSFISVDIASSIAQLVQDVKNEAKLSDDEVPSFEWVRLNFTPKRANSKIALEYTGRFQITYHIQHRDIREYAI